MDWAALCAEPTAAADVCQLEYTVDESGWMPCALSLRLGPLDPGDHMLRVRCVANGARSPVTQWAWTVLSQSSYQLQVRVGPVGFGLTSARYHYALPTWHLGSCSPTFLWVWTQSLTSMRRWHSVQHANALTLTIIVVHRDAHRGARDVMPL
jgi:hypothetical protein